MIHEWEEAPKRENKVAAAVCLVTGIAGIAALYGAKQLPYPAFWQFGGLATLTAAVYFFARWQIRYIYRIEPDDRDARFGLDLTVSRQTGRRQVTDCRLGLGDLQALEVETPQNRRSLRQKYSADRVHSYCPDVLPARAVYLTFDDAGNRIVVRLQPSDVLLALLQEVLG